MRVLEVSANDLRYGDLEQHMAEIQRRGIRIVRGYPTTLGVLAEHLAQQDARFPMQAILTFGETLFPHQRELFEDRFACPIYDAYGGEGLEVGAQCGQHPGYHINAESIIAEVVDEEGRALPMGEEGQLVLTCLDNYAMPFIRYNIQDLGTLSGERCSCGRGLPLLQSVSGRVVDVLITPEGKRLYTGFFTYLMNRVDGVRQYQVVQLSPTELCLRVVADGAFGEPQRAHILRQVSQNVGPSMTVSVEQMGRIPITETGKRRFLVSHLSPDQILRAMSAGR